MKKKILFLCTANSCRSQMAEGLVNHLRGETWEASSAGMEPSFVNPNAIHVLREIDVDISDHQSKALDSLIDQEFDLVITLCSDAEQRCPLYFGAGKRFHIGFDDPAAVTGSDDEILSEFRRVRDKIKANILTFLDDYKE